MNRTETEPMATGLALLSYKYPTLRFTQLSPLWAPGSSPGGQRRVCISLQPQDRLLQTPLHPLLAAPFLLPIHPLWSSPSVVEWGWGGGGG